MASLSLSGEHKADSHVIDFADDWNKKDSPTFKWYSDQCEKSTTFKYLEYREESRYRSLLHEFVVAELEDGTVCRFDRRPEENNRAEVLRGAKSSDTILIMPITGPAYREMRSDTSLVLKVHFPQGQDLITLLATCYAISVDEDAKKYLLHGWNCYFYAWVLVITASRRAAGWCTVFEEPNLWNTLVDKSIGKIEPRLPGSQFNSDVLLHDVLKRKKSDPDETPRFSGAAFLAETLRQNLAGTRANLEEELRPFLFHSDLFKNTHILVQKHLSQCASEAASRLAYHAARDAASEAIAEVIWQEVFVNPKAGDIWEDLTRKTEKRVREAARQSSLSSLGEGLEGNQWSAAWDRAWGLEGGSELTCTRGKKAWKDVWTKACAFNEISLRKISETVVDHLKNSVAVSDRSVKKDTTRDYVYVHEFVQKRIRKFGITRVDPEVVMGRIWAYSVALSTEI